MTTLEGNKLIAEFMELKYDPDKKDGAPFYKETSKDGWESKSYYNPRYHTSWDWLMPVVEKIEKMGYGFHKDPFDLNIVEYISGDENQVVAYQNNPDDSLIYKWHYVVVQFIQWYNQNKPA